MKVRTCVALPAGTLFGLAPMPAANPADVTIKAAGDIACTPERE